MHTGLLDRESLRANNGVKYFRDTLRPNFIKGAQNVFLWRFYQFQSSKEEEVWKIVKWIGRFSLFWKRLRDAWMDNLPKSSMSEEQRQKQYLADANQSNEKRQRRNENALGPWSTGDQKSDGMLNK